MSRAEWLHLWLAEFLSRVWRRDACLFPHGERCSVEFAAFCATVVADTCMDIRRGWKR